jgi:arsenate reductase
MQKPKLLFLSTGDSTRSQMAEGFIHALAGDQVLPTSVGIASGDLNPLAVEVMREVGIDISRQAPQDVVHSLKQHFAYVISICDAARERFPIFPLTINLLHWSLIDPSTVDGSYMARREVFRRVRHEIESKVQLLLEDTLHTTTHSLTAVAGH